MKKIAAVLALLCAPVLVYFGVFLYFEPYDYFGLKGGAVQEDSYITRVRSYLNKMCIRDRLTPSVMAMCWAQPK